MSISRILSECPTAQKRLKDVYLTGWNRTELLPFLDFVNSPFNTRQIKQEISPGGAKLHSVDVTWTQRLPESIVVEGASIVNCTATEKYGDTVKSYSLETTDTYQVKELIDPIDLATHCTDNSVFIYEHILDLADALDRKVASAIAIQVNAQLGGWGTEVSSYFTVAANALRIATRQTGGQALNEFALADIRQATRMAAYPGAPIGFGGAEMERYVQAVMAAGCCNNNGIDLGAIATKNGFAFAYDARLAAALGGNLNNLVTTGGAIQLLSYNLAGWNAGLPFEVRPTYSRVKMVTPGGLAVDLTMSDACGGLSIVMTFTGKIITLPTNLYEASDKYAGINYAAKVTILNP